MIFKKRNIKVNQNIENRIDSAQLYYFLLKSIEKEVSINDPTEYTVDKNLKKIRNFFNFSVIGLISFSEPLRKDKMEFRYYPMTKEFSGEDCQKLVGIINLEMKDNDLKIIDKKRLNYYNYKRIITEAQKFDKLIIIPISNCNKEKRYIWIETKREKISKNILVFLKGVSILLSQLNYRIEEEKELIDIKRQLKWIKGSIEEGVLVIDKLGIVKSVNSVALEILDFKENEVIGNKIGQIINSLNLETLKPDKIVLNNLSKLETNRISDKNLILISRDFKQKYVIQKIYPLNKLFEDNKGYVMIIKDLTKEIDSKEQINELKTRDNLTGLYNRAYFEKEISRIELEGNGPISIIMSDCNGLKMINDVFGYEEGDLLLKRLAKILKKFKKSGDYVVRWGGDEFILLLKNTDEKQAWDICKFIQMHCIIKELDISPISVSLSYATKNGSEKSIRQTIKLAEDYMHRKKLLEIKSARNSVIVSMQKTLSEKSHETEEHALRLKENCRKIGLLLGLSNNEINDLELVALLHDIGKIAISDSILNKEDKLDENEWLEMKKHPEIGSRIVASIPELIEISSYILYHHERWDGRGYPEGLKGNRIPLYSRIVSVVDAYDAMISDRPYRKGMDKKSAIDELIKNSGSQFDSNIVDIFIKHILIE